jgi:hypothetical protein
MPNAKRLFYFFVAISLLFPGICVSTGERPYGILFVQQELTANIGIADIVAA